MIVITFELNYCIKSFLWRLIVWRRTDSKSKKQISKFQKMIGNQLRIGGLYQLKFKLCMSKQTGAFPKIQQEIMNVEGPVAVHSLDKTRIHSISELSHNHCRIKHITCRLILFLWSTLPICAILQHFTIPYMQYLRVLSKPDLKYIIRLQIGYQCPTNSHFSCSSNNITFYLFDHPLGDNGTGNKRE